MEAARTTPPEPPERRRPLGEARQAGVKEGVARTVAQSFCVVGGLSLIAVGILGFIFGGSGFDTGEAVSGEDFLIFEVNGWHNIVHIVTGALLLLAGGAAASATIGALVFGIAYTGVAIWGFAAGNDIANVIAVDPADNWLHVGLAAAGILAAAVSGGLGASASRQRRAVGADI